MVRGCTTSVGASLAHCRPSPNLRQPQVLGSQRSASVSFVVTDLDISSEARALVDSIADELAAVLAYRRERAARDAATADEKNASSVEHVKEAA